jgi:hypothetical protein
VAILDHARSEAVRRHVGIHLVGAGVVRRCRHRRFAAPWADEAPSPPGQCL